MTGELSLPKPAGAALVSAEKAGAMDAEASAEWGLDSLALVEAAGRSCADVFARAFPRLFERRETPPSVVVLAGSGNNAADALVMLRALVLRGYAAPARAAVVRSRQAAAGGKSPLSQAVLSVEKLSVNAAVWDGTQSALLSSADIIIDGIAGSGIREPLHGAALEMVQAANNARKGGKCPLVVSVDLPSGNFDNWRPGMPIVEADAVLAIEPQKMCLYTPASRPFCGKILSVGELFPAVLTEKYREGELLDWRIAAARVPAVAATAHKYERGVAEIWAGSPGASGAAKLAALGAQSAGAGLVRLVVDPSLYSVLASGASGAMVTSGGAGAADGRFRPNAVLLGPGWGKGQERANLFRQYLPLEAQGLPLILDADAIALAGETVFHGNAVLTPHPGEFAAYIGIDKNELLANPVPALKRFASQRQVCILFKSHVLYIAAPDGRLGIIDGMNPALGAGGSGDVLAGFCAAIAARQSAGKSFDAYNCAAAAATLLVQAARSVAGKFADPAEFAAAAAAIAGRAWLPNSSQKEIA